MAFDQRVAECLYSCEVDEPVGVIELDSGKAELRLEPADVLHELVANLVHGFVDDLLLHVLHLEAKAVFQHGEAVQVLLQEVAKGLALGAEALTPYSKAFSSLRGNAAFNQIETRLRHKFGTKITVRKNSSGGGEIGIEFYNADDLERLIDLLDS